MWSMFAAGGFVMVPVLLLGLVTVAAGGCHAVSPHASWRRSAGSLRAALLFASLAGTALDLVAVAARAPELPGELAAIALVGFGEALSPTVLGAVLAAVSALLSAAGDVRST